MREEAAFRCKWKRDENGYTLWVPGYPFTKTTAKDLNSGTERVSELLLEHDVATFSALELVPRPPVAERMRRYATPAICAITGDEPCYCRTVDARELFTGSLCKRCGCVSGERNEQPLILDCPISGDGGFSYDKGRSFSFYSAEFLDQLTNSERKGLIFRKVQSKGRREFFELIGPARFETVDVPKFQTSGWFCSACGFRVVGYENENFSLRGFIARSSLPRRLPRVFAISVQRDAELVVTAERWERLRDLRHSRGILSYFVGVVGSEEIGKSRLPEIKQSSHKRR